ncbi:MAG: hypothetical protein DMF73_11395 [Acidobacteria bacterium]|nr:MAG: hypothetical protein DMF73_11395 [Acidobacteriota bacterium]
MNSQRSSRALRQSAGTGTMNQMLNFADTGGLFDHFEVNREPFWPRIVWLVAGSGAWHLVILALIIMIPPVRDAFSITAMFRDAGFVDRPYSRTGIGDDVDMLDYSTEKFHYPEGYFAMDQHGMPPLPEFPVTRPFTPASVSPALNPSPTPAVTPTPSPTPPVLIAGNNSDGKTTTGKSTEPKPAPSSSPDDKSVEQAQKELEAASKKTGIDLPEEGEINKAPLRDIAKYATQLSDEKKLDFSKPFEVSIDSSLDKDGKLVNPIVTRKTGDETLIDLSKRLVASLNDSGILVYLKKINKDKPGTKVAFTIKQDGNDVSASVETEVSSPSSARTLTSDFAFMIWAGAKSRQGHDEATLLNSTKVSAEGNKIVFKLTMAHKDIVEIVKKGIAEPSPTVTPSN